MAASSPTRSPKLSPSTTAACPSWRDSSKSGRRNSFALDRNCRQAPSPCRGANKVPSAMPVASPASKAFIAPPKNGCPNSRQSLSPQDDHGQSRSPRLLHRPWGGPQTTQPGPLRPQKGTANRPMDSAGLTVGRWPDRNLPRSCRASSREWQTDHGSQPGDLRDRATAQPGPLPG